MEEYNLKYLIQNVRVLSECIKCVYGLPQAGRFSNIKLGKHLADDFYFTTGQTQGLFHHITWPTTFNLVVDNFGAKCFGKHNADNLINTLKTLQRHYSSECGIKLKWDYDEKTINLSMKNNSNKYLARIHHFPSIKTQHYPHPYNTPVYGQIRQFFIPTTTNKILTPAQLKHCT